VRKTMLVLLVWACAVGGIALVFGGGRIAPCLGIQETQSQLDCVAQWHLAHPSPPALLDPAMPWLWLEAWLLGSLAVLAVVRALRD
jgi:hypothetical protein